MSRRSWAEVSALLSAPLVLAWALAGPAAGNPSAAEDKKQSAKEPPAKDIFGQTKVHSFHLQLAANEWETMQAVSGGMRFPGAPGLKPADKPAEKPTDVHKGSGFGMEFPWAHGELVEGDKKYKDVGIRYKGNASYMMASRSLKRNFKIDLDHYDADLRYQGLKTLNLNAGTMDPTKGREALAYAVFRAAGVPAPRTAFAEITLTVPGKYDKELLGLYTVVEQVDKTFLKDRFKNNKGLLMKPENVRSLDYLGDDWGSYKERYNPKRDATKQEAQRVMEFAKLVNKADDDQFRKEIGSYLDVDQFLRFTAVNALVANIDSFSFFAFGHNYYLYLNPDTNKFAFIPWDVDLSLAGFPMGASPDQQMDLSVTHPYAGEHKLIERLLAMKDAKEKYHKILKELATTCFSKEHLLKEVEAIEKTTKELLAKEAKAVAARKERASGFGPPGGTSGRSPDLRTFVEKRTESVAGQLAGKGDGYIPPKPISPGFGGGRPGGKPGAP